MPRERKFRHQNLGGGEIGWLENMVGRSENPDRRSRRTSLGIEERFSLPVPKVSKVSKASKASKGFKVFKVSEVFKLFEVFKVSIVFKPSVAKENTSTGCT